MTQKEAEKGLNTICEVVREELISNKKVQVMDVGSFEVRKRATRTDKNPRTGEKMNIREAKIPLFKSKRESP